MMDGEGEKFDEDKWSTWTSRRDLIEGRVDRAVRERRAWLAERAAAEPRETEEVKRTGPASPAPRLQGRRKGEDTSYHVPRALYQWMYNMQGKYFAHLWGRYRPYSMLIGANIKGFAMGATAKVGRRARRKGKRDGKGGNFRSVGCRRRQCVSAESSNRGFELCRRRWTQRTGCRCYRC